MRKPRKPISVEVKFTEGYEKRFTIEILKILENRLAKGEIPGEQENGNQRKMVV